MQKVLVVFFQVFPPPDVAFLSKQQSHVANPADFFFAMVIMFLLSVTQCHSYVFFLNYTTPKLNFWQVVKLLSLFLNFALFSSNESTAAKVYF